MCSWAVRNNVEAAVQPATFGKGIRGLAASIDLLGGSTAASVPASLLITHDTARDSDLVTCLPACYHNMLCTHSTKFVHSSYIVTILQSVLLVLRALMQSACLLEAISSVQL